MFCEKIRELNFLLFVINFKNTIVFFPKSRFKKDRNYNQKDFGC